MGHFLIRKWFALSSYYEPSVALLLLAPNSVLPLLFYTHASCYRGETPIIVSTIAFSEDTSRLPVCFLTTYSSILQYEFSKRANHFNILNGRHILFLRDNSRSLPFSSPCNLFHSWSVSMQRIHGQPHQLLEETIPRIIKDGRARIGRSKYDQKSRSYEEVIIPRYEPRMAHVQPHDKKNDNIMRFRLRV